MNVGDMVEWISQAAGYRRTKRGEIVEVVQASDLPNKMSRKGLGLPRDHESYVVRAVVVDGSEKQRRNTRLYWPRASQLTLVKKD